MGLGVGDELGNRVGGNRWFTAKTLGSTLMRATGAMSRMKLKLSLS
jgi:hypothetical protein